MITIYKYKLEVDDIQTIEIQGLQRILSVEEQNDNIVLYAQINTVFPNPLRKSDQVEIIITGTGHDRPELNKVGYWTFLGTVKMMGGDLMFHVFYHIRGN
jgi:hypothetical protein